MLVISVGKRPPYKFHTKSLHNENHIDLHFEKEYTDNQ